MQHPAQPATAFSIADIFLGMLRRKLLMVFFVLLGVVAGVVFVVLNSPEYAAETRILITSQATPFDKPYGVTELRSEQIDKRFVTSQVAVLKSDDLARRIVKQLQLEGKGEFDSLRRGMSTFKKTLLTLGFGADPRLMSKEDRAVDRVQRKLVVYELPESQVIALRYAAADGKTAAVVANALSDTFVLSTRESQSGPNARAREWLSGQIEILRAKVSQSEAAAEKFRAEAGLLKGQSATLGAQEISELNTQITLAEAASSETAAKAEEIENLLSTKGSVDASVEVLSSATVQRLREQQLTASQKISELSATYLPNHPKMVAANRELADVDRRIRREALKVVESLQGQAKVAKARASSLRRSLDQLKQREGASLQSDVRLQELHREATADRTLLETMLARFADANARQDLSVQPGYARVIQTATAAATPYFPKVGPTVLLATVVGLGLGLGMAFLAEVMAQANRLNSLNTMPVRGQEWPETAAAKMRAPQSHAAAMAGPGAIQVPELGLEVNEQQVEKALRQAMAAQSNEAVPQLLASMPAVPQLIKAFVQLEDVQGEPEIAEPVARLADAMIETAARLGNRSFCITSVGGSFDAPFLTIALARTLANRKIRTLVIDLVPERPSAMDLMAVPAGPGICDLVSGRSDVSNVIMRDHRTSAQLLRYGSPDAAAKATLAAKLPSILSSLAQIYGVILINAGEATPETPGLVQSVGTVLFLATANRQRDAAAAARTLSVKGVKQSLFVKIVSRDGDTATARQTG